MNDMWRIVVVPLLVAGLAACGGSDDAGGPTFTPAPRSAVTFEDQDGMTASTLFVEVADAPDEQRRGLMGVVLLPADEGMAFVFDEPTETTFWMKDTLIPLSIAFVDADGVVVGIREMEPCEADPCPSYGVDRPFVLAVEANRGWFADRGIGPGDRANLEASDG
ncbi:MAG TPA: DUF192 domain-containing protein [Actinomycetota bacterium]|nr:DUF192 domain-containing protein [Actinomycetota bacterium]